MEFNIKYHRSNTYSLQGILIKSSSIKIWFSEIQRMKLTLNVIKIYAVPDTIPNSIWGCLILLNSENNQLEIGQNEWVQKVSNLLYIAEKSTIVPILSNDEIAALFKTNIHIFHPAFGIVELTETIDILSIIQPVSNSKNNHITPSESSFIPNAVKAFQIISIPQEDIIKNLEENIFPKKENMKLKPLSLFEKGKLEVYKILFNKNKSTTSKSVNVINENDKKNPFFSKITDLISQKKQVLQNKILNDFENLEERNKKQIEKLMELLKNNPNEALKYAIPLDETGTSRGLENNGLMDFSKRWFNFDIFNNSQSTSSGGGSINLGDQYFTLQEQYNKTAEELIKVEEYHKAAFIYLKLLKNHYKAAETLELGKHYQDAAAIYLKYLFNKQKAAECYEKGNYLTDAIELYIELNEFEKVGDLYFQLNKSQESKIFFTKEFEKLDSQNKYLKAAILQKEKLNDFDSSQKTLLKGWDLNKEPIKCLDLYYSNIPSNKLMNEVNSVYVNNVYSENSINFLSVLHTLYKKETSSNESIKELSFEIISKEIVKNPSIVFELKKFNPKNKELTKDTMRFNLKSRRNR